MSIYTKVYSYMCIYIHILLIHKCIHKNNLCIQARIAGTKGDGAQASRSGCAAAGGAARPPCLRARASTGIHTSAYVSIRQHTPAYVIICQHTSAYVRS